ncbi:MAG TPA: metallophosphoesterase [Actinomycetota bacterium]|nr:metallophosphoesterase [Actinomycetota bacterium]
MSRAAKALSMGTSLGGAVALGCVAYGVVEAHRYRLRTHRLPVLPPGARPLTVLQVSDTHLRCNQLRLAAFLASLSGQVFDLVFATGDLLGEPAVVERCARLLGGIEARHGRYYVLGSSDYYAPRFKSYTRYFTRRRIAPTKANRTAEFLALLESQGYEGLTNRTVRVDLDGTATQITGLDDPFLHRDDRRLLQRRPDAEFALCVVHDPAPYLDIAKGGFDLAIAGHTHGGQVRLPLFGSVVTNSDLPNALSMGAHWVGETLLFVTPGLGTGKFGPFRFLAPPEASVLELVPRGQG